MYLLVAVKEEGSLFPLDGCCIFIYFLSLHYKVAFGMLLSFFLSFMSLLCVLIKVTLGVETGERSAEGKQQECLFHDGGGEKEKEAWWVGGGGVAAQVLAESFLERKRKVQK